MFYVLLFFLIGCFIDWIVRKNVSEDHDIEHIPSWFVILTWPFTVGYAIWKGLTCHSED